MNWWATLAVAAALYLGYGIGVLNHDRDRHRWQLAWLIGRAGHHETRLRRIENALKLPALQVVADPPAPPTFADRFRAVGRWLDHRTRPQLEEPSTPEPTPPPAPKPEPPTAPIAQLADVDPWRAQFKFSGGQQS